MNIAGIHGSIKSAGIFKRMFLSAGHSFNIYNVNDYKNLEKADVLIQTNILKYHETNPVILDSYKKINSLNKPTYVIESPIFRVLNETAKYDRWHRLTLGSYYFNEGVYPTNMPSDRYDNISKKYDIILKDWSHPQSNILLLLQKITDSSLNNLYSKYKMFSPIQAYCQWIGDTITEIKKYTDRKIVVRPHPNTTTTQLVSIANIIKKFSNCKLSQNIVYNSAVTLAPSIDLDADIKNSFAVITFNSLSAVYSVINGIPTYVLDPSSVAWEVSRHSLSSLEDPWQDIPREQWLYNMSYCQWQGNEIITGLPLSVYDV